VQSEGPVYEAYRYLLQGQAVEVEYVRPVQQYGRLVPAFHLALEYVLQEEEATGHQGPVTPDAQLVYRVASCPNDRATVACRAASATGSHSLIRPDDDPNHGHTSHPGREQTLNHPAHEQMSNRPDREQTSSRPGRE
jgi:hypothetical protein